MPVDHPTLYRGIIVRLRDANESIMFPTLVNEALAMIASGTEGNRLLTGIDALYGRARFGYTVCIRRPSNMSVVNGNYCMFNKAVRANEADAMRDDTGTVTVIDFNANIITTPDGNRPSFIGLAHELIHAYYNLAGGALAGELEELATVGIGKGAQREITENAIRAEHGIPLRKTYAGINI